MDTAVLLAIVAFIATLGLLVILRVRRNNLEIKPTEVVVAILPVLIFLLLSGKLRTFEFGGFKVETAFANASSMPITSQVTTVTGLPFEPVATFSKGGSDEIPRLIEMKAQALSFRLGQSNYVGSVIYDYITTLAKQPFLRHVVIENPDGSFYAMADARAMAEVFQSSQGTFGPNDFAEWLGSNNMDALQHLPGFVPAGSAVTKDTNKGTALELMETLNAEALPVVDRGARFIGIVDRSRLTASFIVEVSRAVEKR